jgi:hypothetical protein
MLGLHKGKVVPQTPCCLESFQINDAVGFHSKFKFMPKNVEDRIVLQMNSVNAAFCFYDTTNSDNMVIKVQLKSESDPIIHDAVVNFTLNRILAYKTYEQYKSFFMKLHASFIGFIDDDKNPMSYVVVQDEGKKPNPIYARPCVAVSRIKNCYTFAQCLPQNWNLPTFPLKICQFINALLVLGNGVGFAHNDMHSGNVLYDMTEKHFVLIDYGRVHIYRHAKLGEEDLNHCISSIEESEKGKGKGQVLTGDWRYNNYSTETPGKFKIIKNTEVNLGMYVLNDLANQVHAVLAYMFNKQNSNFVSFYTPFIAIDTYINFSDIKNIQPILLADTIKKAFDLNNDPTHLLPFSLMVGYIWYILLNKTYKESGLKTPLAYSNDYVFVVCRETFDVLKEKLTDIYTAIMQPIIRFWTTAHERYYKQTKISGGGFGQEGEMESSAIEKLMESSATEWLNDDTNTYTDITCNSATKWLDMKIKISNMEQYPVDVKFLDTQFNKYKNALPKVVPSKGSQNPSNPGSVAPTAAPAAGAAAAGGSNKRYYILKTEKKTCRRFVMCKGRKWYLDEHRGKYRYSLDKTSVAIC